MLRYPRREYVTKPQDGCDRLPSMWWESHGNPGDWLKAWRISGWLPWVFGWINPSPALGTTQLHVGVSAETKTSNAASLSTASKRHERIQFKLLLVKPTKWTPFMTWIRYVFFDLKNSGRFWLNPRKVCEFYNSFQHHSLSVDLNIIHSTPVKSGSGSDFSSRGQKLWFSCEKTVWMHSDHHCGLRNS